MENDNSIIYGLEFQTRALAAQIADTEKIRFLIGTQSLKHSTNQLHLVELNEETSVLKPTVFQHQFGEIWKLTSSPSDPLKIASCYNALQSDGMCAIKTAILRLPETENPDEIDSLDLVTNFNTEKFGHDVKTTEFHPNDPNKMVTVLDSHVVVWDVVGTEAKAVSDVVLDGKNNPKYTTGKWNPHQNCNQFATATETHIKSYDIRTGSPAWTIESCHGQLVRDLDFNLNKQYHVASCGDDGFLKIWDFRQTSQPVFSRSDHSHWVWSVRINPFHDQLILTASSDARVLLTSATSVSSESTEAVVTPTESEVEGKQIIPDGPLQWCEHEDSVYCVEWSPAEPWTFASLSYDGRLLLTRVKRTYKYQILL